MTVEGYCKCCEIGVIVGFDEGYCFECRGHIAPIRGSLTEARAAANKLAHECDAAHDEIRELKSSLKIASDALFKIEQEPNLMHNADEAVDDYGIEAWDVAHNALATLAALKAHSSKKESGTP